MVFSCPAAALSIREMAVVGSLASDTAGQSWIALVANHLGGRLPFIVLT